MKPIEEDEPCFRGREQTPAAPGGRFKRCCLRSGGFWRRPPSSRPTLIGQASGGSMDRARA